MKLLLILLTLALSAGALPVMGQNPPKPQTGPPPAAPSFSPPFDLKKFELWTTHTSPEGGYSLKLPQKPVLRKSLVKPDVPDLFQNSAVVVWGPHRYFELNYIDFKGKPFSPGPAQEGGLSALINRAISDGGELAGRSDVLKGNCSGKEVTLRLKNEPGSPLNPMIKARTFASGEKLFFIHTLSGSSPEEQAVTQFFIDSFAVTGGCVATTSTPMITNLSRSTVEGTPDKLTGWRRFDLPHGISFVMPTATETEINEVVTAVGKIKHYVYLSEREDQIFSVEVFDGYASESRQDPVLRAASMDSMAFEARTNLAKENVTLEECKPATIAGMVGRECAISIEGLGVIGRAQIIATPRRGFMIMGISNPNSADKGAIDRFFSEYKIKPEPPPSGPVGSPRPVVQP